MSEDERASLVLFYLSIIILSFSYGYISHSVRIFPFKFIENAKTAASLLRQHQNFLDLHERDKFACKYMKAIGHFDFGKNLKPIDFDKGFSSQLSDLICRQLLSHEVIHKTP